MDKYKTPDEILKILETAKDKNGQIPMNLVRQAFSKLPPVLTDAQQDTDKWNRLMMYLADLQLTYYPNWGANGYGDEKLYQFVTELIKELENWQSEPAKEE